MSIIGIIASERQTNQIKKQIENEGLKIQIICINYKSIENIKNIKFEIIIIQDSPDKLKEKEMYFIEILKNTKYLLLNTDANINENILKDIKINVITYGLKHKATITTSSISDTQVIISIQRGFKNINGDIVEQQEIPVEFVKDRTKDLYNSLIRTTIINMFVAKNA